MKSILVLFATFAAFSSAQAGIELTQGYVVQNLFQQALYIGFNPNNLVAIPRITLFPLHSIIRNNPKIITPDQYQLMLNCSALKETRAVRLTQEVPENRDGVYPLVFKSIECVDAPGFLAKWKLLSATRSGIQNF